ncbi:hypothetical protein ACJJTC_012000 [Scirpophaga incertulas]
MGHPRVKWICQLKPATSRVYNAVQDGHLDRVFVFGWSSINIAASDSERYLIQASRKLKAQLYLYCSVGNRSSRIAVVECSAWSTWHKIVETVFALWRSPQRAYGSASRAAAARPLGSRLRPN